jgi:cytochrome bd-type quinol oxidase subunit 2
MRGPTTAAVLIGAAWLCLHTSSVGAHRAAALALGLAIAAAAGLIPYVQDLDPEEPTRSSCVAWAGFLALPLVLTLPNRVLPLGRDELVVLSITLVGLGLVNLAWGTIGAWRAGDELEAWRDSFVADWGLVLVGLGLGMAGPGGDDGRAAAYLALLSIVLVRFPLFLWAREAAPARDRQRLGILNVLLAAALTGAAPFAGFPVRLLLLRAATREAWPLAAVLLAAMVVWVVHAFRLGHGLGRPSGRLAVGVWLSLGLSVLLGLGSGTFLAVARP